MRTLGLLVALVAASNKARSLGATLRVSLAAACVGRSEVYRTEWVFEDNEAFTATRDVRRACHALVQELCWHMLYEYEPSASTARGLKAGSA